MAARNGVWKSSAAAAATAARAFAIVRPTASTLTVNDTRSFSQAMATSAESGATFGNEMVSHSVCSAGCGLTVMRSASISGLYSYIPHRSCCFEKITVHCSGVGMVASEYLPAASMVPLTDTGSANEIVVASLAPVRHTSLYGTRPPQIARPLTPGRLYAIWILVVPTVCDTVAACDTRGTSTCARAGVTTAASAATATDTAASLLIVVIASTPFITKSRQRLSVRQQGRCEASGASRRQRPSVGWPALLSCSVGGRPRRTRGPRPPPAA